MTKKKVAAISVFGGGSRGRLSVALRGVGMRAFGAGFVHPGRSAKHAPSVLPICPERMPYDH
jgi:hypothetical protein